MYCPAARFVGAEKFLPHQRGKRFLESERAVRPRDRDLLMQMLQRVLSDVLPRAIADH